MKRNRQIAGAALWVGLMTASTNAQVSGGFPLENVHSGAVQGVDDYQYVRGVNYLAVYPGLHDANGPFTLGQPISAGGPVYEGIGSTSMMWHYYDYPTGTPGQTTIAHIDEQLLWMKKTGFNSIRVFVSFPYWQYCRLSSDLNAQQGPSPRTGTNNLHIARFQDFVGRCTQMGLKVMPVLWDSVYAGGGGPPTYGAAPTYAANLSQANRHGWHSNPGESEIPQRLVSGAPVPTLNAEATEYVREFMDTFTNDASTFLVWDVMNEPHFLDPMNQSTKALDLIQATFDAIDLHPTLPASLKVKLFSGGVSTRFPETITLAMDSRCNVIGLHPFGQTRLPTEALLFDATHIATGMGAPANLLKPMICTEMGSPGLAVSYHETADYAENLGRPDLVQQGAAAGTTGIGFMPWQFMVPSQHSDDVVPFKWVSGIFYGERSPVNGRVVVRETETVNRFVNLASKQLSAQGITPNWLWTDQEIGTISDDANEPGTFRLPCEVDTDLDEFGGLIAQAQFVQANWQTMSWEECVRTGRAFGRVTGFLDVGANSSKDNHNLFWVPGNPATQTSPPWSLDPADRAALQLAYLLNPPTFYLFGSPQYVLRPGGSSVTDWIFYLTYVSAVTGVPIANLQVWDATTVEGAFHRQRLLDWVNIVLPYLTGRGGP